MTAALGAGILLVMLPKALSGLPGLAAMADLEAGTIKDQHHLQKHRPS